MKYERLSTFMFCFCYPNGCIRHKSGLISLRNLFEGFILLYWQCFGVEESASVRDNTLKHSEKNKS